MTPEAAVGAYIRCFESLQPDSVDSLRALVSEDIYFRDPFNEIRGVDNFIAVFRHMYATTSAPRFTVTRSDIVGSTAYLHWRFEFGLGGRQLNIDGVSELRLNDDGRVCSHIDHWDAASQLYVKLPLIGWLFRWLAARFQTT